MCVSITMYTIQKKSRRNISTRQKRIQAGVSMKLITDIASILCTIKVAIKGNSSTLQDRAIEHITEKASTTHLTKRAHTE